MHYLSVFLCVLLSSISIGYSRFQLRNRPRNILVESRGETEVFLTWDAPRVNKKKCNVISYIIQYKRDGDADDKKTVIEVTSEYRKHVITGLSKNTKYLIQMQTNTCKGIGQWTKWFKIKTLSDSISKDVPLEIFINPSSTSIYISWQPPSTGWVDHYKIGYDTSVPDGRWFYTSRDTRNATIYNLIPSTTYVISIRAVYNNVDGNVAMQMVSTKSVRKVFEPVDLSADEVTSRSLLLTWKDPELHDDNVPEKRYYEIEYKDFDTEGGEKLVKKSRDTSIVLAGLSPNINYEIKVTTINKHGDRSKYSHTLFVQTSDSGRSNDIQSQTMALTSRTKRTNERFRTKLSHHVTAVVSWSDNPEARSYVLRYQKQGGGGGGGGEELHPYVTVETNDNFVLLERLAPFAVYQYQLQYVKLDDTRSKWTDISKLSTRDEL